MERGRQAVERALRRRAGPDQRRSQEILEHHHRQEDLFVYCPQCGARRYGPLATLRTTPCEECGHAP